MLHKIKRQIDPILDTIREAMTYLFTLQAAQEDAILADITAAVTSINQTVAGEAPAAAAQGAMLLHLLPAFGTQDRQNAIWAAFEDYKAAISAIPVQIKVLFLPYYENTWDSLESIYLSLAADARFVCEIVIIPILRNTPAGVKHVYEDYLTPNGVANTHYSQYNVEKDRPDIVFYNNPYDSTNYPQFQSAALKPYARCMIYVPYALAIHVHRMPGGNKLQIDAQAATELPGQDHADVYIAPGKAFYKRYAKTSRNGSKMVVLGNPKTDYLHEKSKEGRWPRYPAWEDILRGKTTFLLNTHYSSFFEKDSHVWLKMLFRLIKDDEQTALIWRPHPQLFVLLDSCGGDIQAMFAQYQDEMAACGRMILDDTPSILSAFQYSRAVLSEYSSIIAGALCLRKPVFLLEVEPREYRDDPQAYYQPDYRDVIRQTQKSNRRDMTLFTALPSFGLRAPLDEGQNWQEALYEKPMRRFLADIQNGNDSGGALREKLRAYLMTNADGNCADAIRAFVVNKLIEGGRI